MSAKINVTLKESKINAKTSIVNYYKGDKGDKGEKGDKGDNGKDGVGAEELQRINNEIVSARKDIFGKEYNNLAERLDSDSNKALVEGLKASFLKKKGKGSITAKNTLEGSIRNLKILGNTTGGYDSETSTSSALASVGQAEGGKISILSTGKNLLNVKEMVALNPTLFSYSEDNGRAVLSIAKVWTQDINLNIRFKPNTAYTISYMSSQDSNGMFIKVLYTDGSSTSVVYPQGGYKICSIKTIANKTIKNLGISSGEKKETFFDVRIMVEEGTTATDYEHYKSDKKDILLPANMRGLNGWDYMQNDEIVQGSCDIIVNGDSELIVEELENTYRVSHRLQLKGKNTYPDALCDKKRKSVSFAEDNEHFYIGGQVSSAVYIFVEKKKITNGIKNYFKDNPHRIIYELETPTIHKLEPTKPLSTFRALTTLTVETEVEAGLEAEFPVDTNGTLTRLDRENEEFEKENNELKSNQSFLAQTLYNILEVSYMPSDGIDKSEELLKLKQIIGGGIDVTTDNE